MLSREDTMFSHLHIKDILNWINANIPEDKRSISDKIVVRELNKILSQKFIFSNTAITDQQLLDVVRLAHDSNSAKIQSKHGESNPSLPDVASTTSQDYVEVIANSLNDDLSDEQFKSSLYILRNLKVKNTAVRCLSQTLRMTLDGKFIMTLWGHPVLNLENLKKLRDLTDKGTAMQEMFEDLKDRGILNQTIFDFLVNLKPKHGDGWLIVRYAAHGILMFLKRKHLLHHSNSAQIVKHLEQFKNINELQDFLTDLKTYAVLDKLSESSLALILKTKEFAASADKQIGGLILDQVKLLLNDQTKPLDFTDSIKRLKRTERLVVATRLKELIEVKCSHLNPETMRLLMKPQNTTVVTEILLLAVKYGINYTNILDVNALKRDHLLADKQAMLSLLDREKLFSTESKSGQDKTAEIYKNIMRCEYDVSKLHESLTSFFQGNMHEVSSNGLKATLTADDILALYQSINKRVDAKDKVNQNRPVYQINDSSEEIINLLTKLNSLGISTPERRQKVIESDDLETLEKELLPSVNTKQEPTLLANTSRLPPTVDPSLENRTQAGPPSPLQKPK